MLSAIQPPHSLAAFVFMYSDVFTYAYKNGTRLSPYNGTPVLFVFVCCVTFFFSFRFIWPSDVQWRNNLNIHRVVMRHLSFLVDFVMNTDCILVLRVC